MARKKRTAKQIAAFKKMIAALHKKRPKKRKTARRKRVSRRVFPQHETLTIDKGEIMGTRKRKRRTTHKRRKISKRHYFGGGGFMGKRHKIRHHRRKRSYMGGLDVKSISGSIMEGAGIVGGAVGASFLSRMIPISNAKLKAAIPVALGLGLGMTKFGKRGIMKDVAMGSITIGMISLLKSFVPSLPLLDGDVELMGYLPTSESQAMLGMNYDGDYDGMSVSEFDGDFDGDFEGEL